MPESNGDHQSIVLLLVNNKGMVLGGDIPHLADVPLPARLSEVLMPYRRDSDFAAWWADLLAHAPGGEKMAFLHLAGQHRTPVSVRVVPVAHDEYVVSCFPPGYRRLPRLNALYHIGVATSRLELNSVLRTVREQIYALLPADCSFYIALYDQEPDRVIFKERMEDGEFCGEQISQMPHDGLIGWVMRNRQSLLINDIERDPLPVTPVVYGRMPRALILVPLVAHGEQVGAISVQSYQPDIYREEDFWWLEAVAGQTAIAIRNAYLYEQTVSRLAMLESLQHTALRLASAFDQEHVTNVIGQAVLDLLKPDEVRIYLRDRDTNRLRFIAGWTPAGGTPRRRDPGDGMLVTAVDAHGAPFVVHDASEHEGVIGDFDWQPGAVAGYPIRRAGNRYGVLLLLYKESHFFRQDERRTLSLMAHQAAIAVENTTYHADLMRRFEEVAALYTLAQQVTEQLDSDKILQMVVHTLRDIMRCRACVIALREEESDDIVIRAAVGVKEHWRNAARFRVGQGITGRIVATGKSIYVPDIYAEPDLVIYDPDVHSVLAVPITFQGRVIGSLNLDSERRDAFSLEYEHILTIAAAQVAAALENARLYRLESERARKLAEANEALKSLERLREEFIQNLSHELRTPLTYIKGYVSLLDSGEMGPVTQEQREALQIVMDKSDAIERLIRDVVTLEEISEDSLVCQPVDVNDLARKAFDSTRLMHRDAGLNFDLELVSGPCWVNGDISRLQQVLDNLLGNAVKFTPVGGTITVRTHLRDEADGRFVEITVSDTGPGMAAEHLDRVFERFYRVKVPGLQVSGSGIGLAIVRRVIEAHHGRVWVESEVGKGSTFYCSLPVMERRQPDET